MSDVVTQFTNELIGRLKPRPVLLQAENIEKIYKKGEKEIRAIGGISLEVRKGEILIIIGPSGAGKSTLLHVLGGLNSSRSGKVLIDGVDLYGISDVKRARIRNEKIGFVFQFYHLLPEFTVLENTMLPALMQQAGKETKKSIAQKARTLLEAVGLSERINHKPDELSGGEAQRVAIARALINEPAIVFCDEPTGNLDSKTSQEICMLIHKLSREKKISFVIVTHESSLAEKATKVLRIRDGKLQ